MIDLKNTPHRITLPQIYHLLAGYFHQDFYDEFGTVEEVITHLKSNIGVDEKQLLIGELQKISAYVDEGNEINLLKDFDCYYLPDRSKISSGEWLIGLLSQIL